jgi:adenylate kinase family enzyme/Ca2+-binding EF-hand superfamily protein
MIQLKKFFQDSKPADMSLSRLWETLGKKSTNAKARKKKRYVVSDEEIRKRQANEGGRLIVKNTENFTSRFHLLRPVRRAFSQRVQPTIKEYSWADEPEWNSPKVDPWLARSLRNSAQSYAGQIVLAEPNPEFTSHQYYAEREDECPDTLKPLQDISNMMSLEIKLTRDIFRAFARLQESEGFVPGLIDTKEVLYKDDFKALLTCLGAYPTDELMDEAFARADTSGRGWISYRRFLKAKFWILSQGHEGFDYANLFDMLDLNKDGRLSLGELSGLTTASGHVLTPEEAAIYFKEIGKSPEDVITKDEFVQILCRRQDLAWILRTGFRAVFLLGPPASGKGTYCEEINKLLNVNHVSTGNLLREEVAAKTTLGKRVEQIMKRGDLVDSSTTTVLIQKYLRVNPGKHILVDGFPRSLQNSTDFLRLCGRPEFALVFDAPDDVLLERMRKRALSSGRADDQDENTGKRRIKVYRETTHMIVQNLINNGVDVHTIDATMPKEQNVRTIVSLMTRAKN